MRFEFRGAGPPDSERLDSAAPRRDPVSIDGVARPRTCQLHHAPRARERLRAMPLLRIAIIEDQHEIREGLASLINGTEGYQCTGSFRSMEEALARIGRDLPDVALIDIGLPGMSGIEGTRLLKERYPNLLLLILTVYDDDDRIFEALCAGACGYLLKKTPSARLLESLREAMNGGAPMSPEVARRVDQPVPAVPTAAARGLPTDPARSAPAEDARAGAQLHERRRRARRELQHHRLSHAEHLSEAAGALEVRGGGESAARAAGLKNPQH